ncbi:hypothetical protein F511_17966 [Dorcoceras hygrometricum]|uniref:Uncharacterized protein n=1 Tax=Dorcoceras hygrometricum TaxID=472368 RepID=A0A2Z7AD03_9LAMI|nr:hypothetical protein F511_17966 [Dorcoceras hygrometricum]
MSLFDLQDVCIAIGSIATLDLPMVVDLIGIYGLKGPYCTLTSTNWFLQTLSGIPRGSWGDVARRSYHDPLGRHYQGYLGDHGAMLLDALTMIRWANSRTDTELKVLEVDRSDLIDDRSYDEVTVMGMNRMFIRCVGIQTHHQVYLIYDEVTVMGMNRMFIRWAGPSPSSSLLKVDLDLITHNLQQPQTLKALVAAALFSSKAAAAASLAGICSGQLDEENPSAPISSGLLVQADEGFSLPVVDLIDVIYRLLPIVLIVSWPNFCSFAALPGGVIRIRRGSPTVVSEPRFGFDQYNCCLIVSNFQPFRSKSKESFGTWPPAAAVCCGAVLFACALRFTRLHARLLDTGRLFHAWWPFEDRRWSRDVAPLRLTLPRDGVVSCHALAAGLELLAGSPVCKSLHAGRWLCAMAGRASRDCAALVAAVRGLAPCMFFVVEAAPGGRRSGDAPAMS